MVKSVMNIENSENLTLSFHGVAYDGQPKTVALDGIGGAMEKDGSVIDGVNEAVRGHLEVILEHEGLSGLPDARSMEDVRADFGNEDGVVGFTTTTVSIDPNGHLVSVDSTYEDFGMA